MSQWQTPHVRGTLPPDSHLPYCPRTASSVWTTVTGHLYHRKEYIVVAAIT